VIVSKFLNDSTVVGWLRNSGGSKFQVTMVLGRNEYLYASTLVLICRMLWAQDPLVLVVLIGGCPQDVKSQAYTTLVRPVLEYICTHLQFGIHTRSNRSMHWNGYNDKPPDLSPVIISADQVPSYDGSW
jgi:hypothetical protein